MSHKCVVHNHLHVNHNYTAIYISELARESFWTFGIFLGKVLKRDWDLRSWDLWTADVPTAGFDMVLLLTSWDMTLAWGVWLRPSPSQHVSLPLIVLRGIVAGLPSWTRFFKSVLQSVQTGCGAHPASSSTHTHLVSRIRISGAIPPSPLRLYECTWAALLFSFFYAKVSTRSIFFWSAFLSSLVWSASSYIVLSALAMFYCSFLPQELRTRRNRVGREAGRKKNKGRKGGGRTTESNI